MNKLQAMQLFVRVVETRALSRAADSLQMPKATATTPLQQLEADLDLNPKGLAQHQKFGAY